MRKKIFDCSIGYPQTPARVLRTIEGGRIEQIAVEPIVDAADPVWELKQYCKAGLTNLVFENYKRKKQGLPPILVLFCIDIDENRHPVTPQSVSSKEQGINNLVTMAELRRSFKLCCLFDDEEIREVASETFKFVKVSKTEEGEFALHEIPAPWKARDWNQAWAARKELSKAISSKKRPWDKQLKQLVSKYRAEHGIMSSIERNIRKKRSYFPIADDKSH